jgi:hydroxysqualene dehydroxylase
MNVAVVGGGYAGLAAAVTLAERGVPVTVFEAAAHLGGRARRVRYNDTALDNGLHILIGACRETLRLVRLVNGAAEERALLRLPFDWRIHRRFRLAAASIPSPLHFLFGLLFARGAGRGARLAAIRFVRAMRAQGFSLPQDMSVDELLALHRQDDSIARFLWRPLCVAALNTPSDEASAQVFLNVLRDALGTRRADSEILLARCDLTALFPEPAADYVRGQGGTVLAGHTVTSILADGSTFNVHARGTSSAYTHVICALPPHRLAPAIAALPRLGPTLAMVGRFGYQPIYSVYLQYAGSVRLPAPMMGMAGGLAHWLFDRQAICGQRGLLAAVISAAGPHQDMTQDELAQRVHADIERCVGPLPALLWRRVIAEKRATFACTVGLERPARRTALRNFYLAGDYTASGHPATIEAAVRSGVQCARDIIASQPPGAASGTV